jgi:glycosyltransferase involved in cell wall biosynthesis
LVAVIVTVLNEGESIDRLMNSLIQQTLPPNEVVIVDGGSRDDTVARIERYKDRLPLKIIVKPDANISEGRNLAIQHSTQNILAITDAGVRFDNTWVEKITAPLRVDSNVMVSSGFFVADPMNLFEVAMSATVLPLVDEIDPKTFLPSSRSVAVRKSAAVAVQGYPEWLDYCEDLIFDMNLKQHFAPFAFAKDAIVSFRPRGSLRAFFKQYYLYARGDGKANLFLKRQIIRYVVYGMVLPMLLFASVFTPLAWLILIVAGLGYCSRPLRRLPTVMKLSPRQDMLAWFYCILMIPVIRLVGDIARMLGYPVGRWWRMQNIQRLPKGET